MALPLIFRTDRAQLRQRLDPQGPLCIESNPADLDDATVSRLAGLGFESVSVGVQSFDERVLSFLGRGYTAGAAHRALDRLAASGIPSVNLDLMFAVPGQDEASWQRDLDTAIASPATQVTAYPLFTFPYSEIGTALGIQEGTSKAQLSRARARLRTMLADFEGEWR